MEKKKPVYLYNPDLCPCPRGEAAGCPRYKSCEDCISFHRANGKTRQTACERKAGLLPNDEG